MMFLSVVLVLLLLLQLGVRSHPCDLRRSEEYGGLLADCSGRGLTSVPSDLPSHIVALDLSSNNIAVIRNFTFSRHTNMTFLSFYRNRLKNLEPMAFSELSKLKILNLNGNLLRSNHPVLPVGVFNSLINLKTLWIEDQFFDTYPDWIFLPLVNLQTLYLDSIRDPMFRKGFSNLKKLEYLQLDGHGQDEIIHCNLAKLSNETFEGLRNIPLKTLNASYCRYIEKVEPGVFEPLGFLDTLIFSRNDIGIPRSLQLLKPFVGRTMKRIDFSSVCPHHRLLNPNAADSYLNDNDTVFLSKICVKELFLSSNRIVYIAKSALFGKPFCECIETLDLSKNGIIGDILVFFKLSLFTNMKTLLLGETSFEQLNNENVLGNHSKTIAMTLPETLEVFDISGFFKLDTRINMKGISVFELRNARKLNTFISSNNKLEDSLKFKGIENIEILDLSYNIIRNINDITFEPFRKVRTLLLKSCNLRFSKRERNDLTNFPNVKVIDISQNLLSKFPILANPGKVEVLILDENSFDSLPINVELFPMLQRLELTFNAISSLSVRERGKLDNAYMARGLKLHLRGNTFSCGCKELDLVQWLIETPAVYETDRRFSCILDDGTTTDIMKVSNNIQYHIRHCRGPTIFTLTITFGLLLIIALSGTYVIMKNPTRYQHLLLRFIGLQRKVFTRDDFPFMLYVAYTSSDIPLVYRQLRPALERQNIPLFLKDREVLPGYDIADGVSDGINSSWKTLLVVSVDFLNDPWSTFIINSSLYSMTEMIPNRIIILLVDGVKLEDVPDTLLRAVDEDFVLEYYAAKEHNQWDELVQLLK